jgi:hypothetical protein
MSFVIILLKTLHWLLTGGQVEGSGDPRQPEEPGDQLLQTLGSLHQGPERHQRDFSGK